MTTPILLFIINLLLGAWGLPIVLWATRAWTRTYTRLVAPDRRQRQIDEVESELTEQIEGDRALGYKPSEIALRIARRVVCGVVDNITWTRDRLRAQSTLERLDTKTRWLLVSSLMMTIFFIGINVGFIGSALQNNNMNWPRLIIPMILLCTSARSYAKARHARRAFKELQLLQAKAP